MNLYRIALCSTLALWLAAPSLAEDRLDDLQDTKMRPGKYEAASSEGRGRGFSPSSNMSKAVDEKELLEQKKLVLVVRPDRVVPYRERFRGMRLLLANGTDDRVQFVAIDSRLSIVQEAQDSTGAWKPIEFVQKSWCGNSYHSLVLKPHEFWEFSAPRDTGTMKTKLRFVLNADVPLYSNEFEGSIDPGQFTQRKRDPVNGE